MPGKHTIEKIGGTSMSRFGDVMDNVIIGGRKGKDLYNRVFVVSAYSSITNLLLEDKKTGAPGVFGFFSKNDQGWTEALEKLRGKMLEYNKSFEGIGLDVPKADAFVNERIEGIKTCLHDLLRLRSYGNLWPSDYLGATREFIAAFGEAHSAFNSTLILQANGVNAVLLDLSGWKDTSALPIDEEVRAAFKDVNLETQMPIVTGYINCVENMMERFDRGYSEITFSKIAVITDAREGVIHKEYHLSTGDPVLIGKDKVQVIGNTNFDIADQLSDMGMEAIHAKAAKDMEYKGIPIRVKNAFEPGHPGTLISRDYVSPTPKVDMICGRCDLIGIEVYDPEMVGESGYDYRLTSHLDKFSVSYIAKNTNANTITHYISEKAKGLDSCIQSIKDAFPSARVDIHKVAIVSVIGSNMKIPGFLARAAKALFDANINVLALDQTMRQVNIQFILERDSFKAAQLALHKEFVEK